MEIVFVINKKTFALEKAANEKEGSKLIKMKRVQKKMDKAVNK